MNNHTVENKIRTLQRQGKIAKTFVIGALAIGAVTGAFLLGGGYGFSAGKDHAVALIRAAINSANYPMVYEEWPSKKPLAIFENGICIPYPRHVPKYHYYRYVSPLWRPCEPQHPVVAPLPSPALAAIEKETEK